MNADQRRWRWLAAAALLTALGEIHCTAADLNSPIDRQPWTGVVEYADELAPMIGQHYPDNSTSIVDDSLPFTRHIDAIIGKCRANKLHFRLPSNLFRVDAEQRLAPAATSQAIGFAVPFSGYVKPPYPYRYKLKPIDWVFIVSDMIPPKWGGERYLPIDETYHAKHLRTVVEQHIEAGFPLGKGESKPSGPCNSNLLTKRAKQPLLEGTMNFTRFIASGEAFYFSHSGWPTSTNYPRCRRIDDEDQLLQMKPTTAELLIDRGFPLGEWNSAPLVKWKSAPATRDDSYHLAGSSSQKAKILRFPAREASVIAINNVTMLFDDERVVMEEQTFYR